MMVTSEPELALDLDALQLLEGEEAHLLIARCTFTCTHTCQDTCGVTG
jgi:hypothetical protein